MPKLAKAFVKVDWTTTGILIFWMLYVLVRDVLDRIIGNDPRALLEVLMGAE